MPARADRGWSPRGPGWDKLLLVVAMLLAAAGCSGAPHSVSSPPSTQPPSTPTATTLPAFDRSRFAAILPVAGAGNLAVANGRLWVLTGAGTVVRLDPATNRVVGKPLRVPADTTAIAAAQGALWVTTVADGDLGAPGKDTVARIDLATGRTVATITVPRAPLDLAATPRAVWVTNAGAGSDSVARSTPGPTGFGPAGQDRRQPPEPGRGGRVVVGGQPRRAHRGPHRPGQWDGGGRHLGAV